MKKFILAIVGVFILVLAGVSLYVSMIDWNSHKEKLTEQLMEITGKKVVFTGPVSMTVFPSPKLEASNVRVYSVVNPDLKNPLMTVKNVVADLSLSALLGGSFDVKMMSLVSPEVVIRKKGEEINWLDSAKTNSQAKIKDINVSLNSVLLDDATFIFMDEDRDRKTVLNNVKAEIVADSLNGPYRVDGSYIKDNNPGGFAISVGNLSDSFATNLNLVLSQPASESYLRFDGTFLLNNEALNGNLVFESKDFKKFYDSVTYGKALPSYFNNSVEASTELKINKTQLEFANMILKYGDSAGAGSIVVPLKSKSYIIGEEDDEEPKEINVKFDMTDFNLEPFVRGLRHFYLIQTQENSLYAPEYPFDLNVNLTALKAKYNGQAVKDFAIKLNLRNDVWQLESIGGVFPGNTIIKMGGKIFSVEDILSYNTDIDIQTENLKKFLEWLGVPVKTVANSTYQRSSLKANIAGDVKNIQISPLSLAIDNTILTGKLGLKRGKPSFYTIDLSTDSIILDNYLPRIFNDSENPLDVLASLWKSMKWANTVDINFNLKSGLIIYEKTSFDKVAFKGVLQQGILNLQNLTIGEFLKSNLRASGEITGFGGDLQFSNLNYNLSTEDFAPWIQRLNLEHPKWNIKYFEPFNSVGIASMNHDRFWLKADNKTGDVVSSYNGRIETKGKVSLNGEVNLQASDAAEFLRSIPLNYVTKDEKLGGLKLKGQIVGSPDKFKLSDMQLSMGANTFQGAFGMDTTRQIPYFAANLKINRFEPERFVSKGNETPRFSVDKMTTQESDFLSKPNLAELPFERAKIQNINFVANLNIDELLLKDKLFKNFKAQIEDKNNVLKVNNLVTRYNEGDITANLKYTLGDKPKLLGTFSITNQNIREKDWSGKIYGIKSGVAEINATIDTSAISPRELFDKFSGVVNININSPIVKGINLASISGDLSERQESKGLQTVLQNNLRDGDTRFDEFSGEITFKDGLWQLDRTYFKSDLATIGVEGNGNLSTWNIDSVFAVQLSYPENVQPFAFTLKGMMSNPELDIDASPITQVYDEKQAKIEAEKRAQQEVYEQNIQRQFEMQRTAFSETKAIFKDFMDNNYKPLKAKFVYDENKKLTEALDERLEKLSSLFEEGDALLQEKEIKEEYPAKLAALCKTVRAELDEIHSKMQNLYIDDMRKIAIGNYNLVKEDIEVKDALSKDTIAKRDEEAQRLKKIVTNYTFQNDSMYLQLWTTIEEYFEAYEDVVKNVGLYLKRVAVEQDIPMLEKYVTDSAEVLVNAQKQHEILKDAIDRYLNYINEKVNIEEKKYQDKLEAEENAKKLEENIGTITESATGKVQTIIRGIDEIEESENKLPTPDSIGEIGTDDLEVNLLKKSSVSGAVSGTISKK